MSSPHSRQPHSLTPGHDPPEDTASTAPNAGCVKPSREAAMARDCR
jgi:hypothetical protein